MSKQRKESGRCVFCGGGNLTKEHIWSDWVQRVITPTSEHTQFVIHEEIDNEKNVAIVQPFTPEHRQGALVQRKLRRVCRTCNGDWMSKIVNCAKPFAKSMILDLPSELNIQAQTDVAAWIAIASIMAEMTDVKTAGIPSSDREIVARTKAPPETWTICLGRYKGKSYAPSRYRHHGLGFAEQSVPGPTAVGSASPEKLQFTTYSLQALLVHAFSCTNAEIALRLRQRLTPSNMIRIWPIQADLISWPPSAVLDDNDVALIADQSYFRLIGNFNI